jgi:hypothetical protein
MELSARSAMRVTLLLLVPCLSIRLSSPFNDRSQQRSQVVGVIQEEGKSSAGLPGAVAHSGNESFVTRVPKLRELDYLQGQTSEDYLVEVSYLNHRIVFPEVFREEANRPYERFRESFEHLQTKLPAHGDVAAKRKEHPIIFVHIHKYGGTSVCLLAKLNGEQVPSGSCNCNFCTDSCKYSQGPRMQPHDYGSKMLPHTSVSYAQIERDVLPQDLDEFLSMEVRTGVMLRDPMEGVLANIVAHKIGLADLEIALKTGDFRRAYAHERGCLKQAHNPDVASHLIQSFATRSLSGFFDVKSTTDEHLESAKRNLDKFNVVQILEDLNIPKFAEQFGWNSEIQLTKKNSVGANAKNGLREKLKKYGLWDRLREVNEHDIKLYEYAREKFK